MHLDPSVSARQTTDAPVAHEEQGWRVENGEAAIARALSIVGLDRELCMGTRASLATVRSDETPFLHQQITGRLAWHVILGDCQPRDPARQEGEAFGVRTLDVLLAPQTGCLLKVSTRWAEGKVGTPPILSALSAEDQMRRAGNERFHAFPATLPVITLVNAIYAVGGWVDPDVAQQIVARYVMWSRVGIWEKARPVWYITLWGIPPVAGTNPIIPVEWRSHAHYVVDAQNGKWLCMSTTPQPDPDDVYGANRNGS